MLIQEKNRGPTRCGRREIGHVFIDGLDVVVLPTPPLYRAHKHLAKAFNSSKITNSNMTAHKTRRNLASGVSLLTHVMEI